MTSVELKAPAAYRITVVIVLIGALLLQHTLLLVIALAGVLGVLIRTCPSWKKSWKGRVTP